MASDFYNNSVFWVEVSRINPNPYQPRKEFNQESLESLAESIRQYGVLQPLVVTRREIERGDGGITVEYELVAGERRLRASKIAGINQVPVLIRSAEDSDKMKLELAIIENLQREDLNPIDRALAFKQLADQFNLKHTEIAKKVGRSREYVSNSLRLLALPEEIQRAVIDGQITEGHTRPLQMLSERPAEQSTLFKEIMAKSLTVRETERIARGIATDKTRKQHLSPELATLERELTERLGTRVQIETRENGGKVHIDFFSPEDIQHLVTMVGGALDIPMPTPPEPAAPEAPAETETPAAAPEAEREEPTPVPDEQLTQQEAEVASPPPPVASSPAVDEDEEQSESPLMRFVAQAPQLDEPEEVEELEAPDTESFLDAPESTPVAPQAAVPTTPSEEQATPAEPQKEDADEDLYSVRNFSL